MGPHSSFGRVSDSRSEEVCSNHTGVIIFFVFFGQLVGKGRLKGLPF